jgi:glycosyltransferase involved in cell wall biosynthesis
MSAAISREGEQASPLCISVAVPVRDEAHTVERLLESLIGQSRAPDEIVLADGGSTDRTVEIARRYATRGVKIIQIGPAFPGRARNEATRAALHDWVAFIDGGCIAEPNWLAALAAMAETHTDTRVVYGNYVPELSNGWQLAQALTIVPPLDRSTGCRPPSTASCLVHRSVLAAAGGFSEHLRAAEDLIFFDRVAELQLSIGHAPEAVVRWSPPLDAASVFRRLRLYSQHHLRAGLGRTWHRRVMAMDVAAAVVLAAAFAWPLLWALPPLALLVRVVRSGERRRQTLGVRRWTPLLLARCCWLIVLADVAAWLGALDHWRQRRSEATGT